MKDRMNVFSEFGPFFPVHFFIADAFLSFYVYVIHKMNIVFVIFKLVLVDFVKYN